MSAIIENTAELAEYISGTVHTVRIHVIGDPGSPRIVVAPQPVIARMNKDSIHWFAGANCGDWEVNFPGGSPLDPAGPYSNSGPTGGKVVGAVGVYKYDVTATDLRTGNEVSQDPDAVIIPG